MINRIITDQLRHELLTKHKVLMLMGARQVGKTTLLKVLVSQLDQTYIWINGDQSIYQEYLSVRDIDKIKELIGDHQIIIIDEAQNIPDIGLNLKLIHDELPDIKVIITGSSSIELSNSVQETLTGRKRVHHLFPISIEELVSHSSKFEVKKNLDHYLLYGLYPEVLQLSSGEEKRRHLMEIIDSYLYRDVLMLSNIRKSDKIYKLLQLLAYQIGSLVSVQELAKKLGLNHETVNHYLDLLEKSFVIKRLSGWASNPRKEISKMDKIYFIDIGIRNALIENFSSIDIRSDIGNLWENFVVMERIKFLSYHNLPQNLYFWKRYSGAEIDIVEQRDGMLHGIEIKWNKKRKSPPKSWTDNYPNSTFRTINKEGLFDLLEL